MDAPEFYVDVDVASETLAVSLTRGPGRPVAGPLSVSNDPDGFAALAAWLAEHDAGPEQRHTGEIVTFVPWEVFDRWKDTRWRMRGEDYEAFKQRMTDQLLSQFFEHLPELEPLLDYAELSTPLSTDFFCDYRRGEMYGLSHDPQRFDQDWLRPRTRIPGLYLTGQDVLSCGVGGAMFAGFTTALSVLGLRQGASLLQQFGRAARSHSSDEGATGSVAAPAP